MQIDELKKEIEQLKRANEELSLLNNLCESFGLTFNFQDIVKTIIQKSIRAVKAEQGSIVLIDGGDRNGAKTLVRSMVSYGGSTALSPDQMLVGWMFLHKEPLNLYDPRQDDRFTHVRWDETIKSVACVPLLIKSELTGMLVVFNKQSDVSFTDEDLRLLTIIATHSAQIVENARLHGVEQLHEALKAAQTQLVQSKKMAALGALVAGVVHELNTPIAAIGGANDVSTRYITKIHDAMRSEPEGAPGRVEIEGYIKAMEANTQVIEEAGKRISEFARSLKSFARLDESDCQEVDLHEGLENTLALLEHQFKDRIRVTRQYGALPIVKCNPAEMNQVYMHILTNAAQAIDGDGIIDIRTGVNGDRIQIQISDSGPGILEDHLSGLFDPVFSKKGGRVKAGMGLFTCSNIIEKHGGQIKAESDGSQGATFTIQLPVRVEN